MQAPANNRLALYATLALVVLWILLACAFAAVGRALRALLRLVH
jgi:hypothetical protein